MLKSVNFKIIGSILMLLGTCIGAGVLALPLAAAEFSYYTNLLYLLSSWGIMVVGAFALLEVNLWMPTGSNLFTMSKNTLGDWGNLFSLIIYLLLLYALISAYISGCSDVFSGILANNYGINLSATQSTLLVFTVLFSIVAWGIHIIDLTNRLLMAVKLSVFLLMLCLMLRLVNFDLVNVGSNGVYSINSFMIMITAFGFSIILPSLRAYLEDNHDDLIKTLIIGCFVPLILYSLWIFAVQGLIPKAGDNGLINIANTQNPNTSLIKAISQTSGYSMLPLISKIFISISAITSFLGVGLCLVDFIKDMVNYITGHYLSNLPQKNINYFGKNIIIYTLSFGPPLTLVLFNPGVFIKALSYAGILVLIFLVFLPLLMLYSGRYRLKYVGRVFLPGGQFFLVMLLFITAAILAYTIIKLYVY